MSVKASELIKALQLMSARLSRGKVQFNPMKITMANKEGKIALSTTMANFNKTASIIAEAGGFEGEKIKGKGMSFCVDVDVMIDYFEQYYGPDEIVTMTFSNESASITTHNGGAEFPTTCQFWLEDESAVKSLETFPMTLKDGMVYYMKGTIKPETEVTVDAAEIQRIIKGREHVKRNAKEGTGPKVHHFKFEQKRSVAVIGDLNDKTVSPVITAINCKVDGPAMDVILGADSVEQIIGVQNGEIKIFGKTGYPVWIVVKGDKINAGYLIAPMEEAPEVQTEVSEAGDVQVVEGEVPEAEIVEDIEDEA